jgi:hypothetical protein
MRGERKSSKTAVRRLSTLNGIAMTPLCVEPRSGWSADETTTSLCGPFASCAVSIAMGPRKAPV